MLKNLKNRREGFTIIELLIVIVVIGILALLVLNTFQGVQARARDAERQTDLNAVRTQLEVYFFDNGKYPSLAQLTATDLAGLDAEALVSPNEGAWTGTAASASTAAAEYGYVATPSGCDNSVTDCTGYDISVWLEDADEIFTKSALN